MKTKFLKDERIKMTRLTTSIATIDCSKVPKYLRRSSIKKKHSKHLHYKLDILKYTMINIQIKISMGNQTYQLLFFEYILDFINIIENSIKMGSIKIQDMNSEQQKRIEQSRVKLKEIDLILERLGQMKFGRDDNVFFKIMAKAF